MIKQQRHVRILAVLRREGAVSLDGLARLMPEVSRVTLRRDIAELAEGGALKRTHGGAVLPDAEVLARRDGVAQLVRRSPAEDLERADAVILPPVTGRGGAALRRRIVERGMPFLAESAPQEGGAYLGPENYAAGEALGRLAGAQTPGGPLMLLKVCQPELSNTRARSEGFEAALRATHPDLRVVNVNGQGAYRTALRVTLDALRAERDITMAFAVNDHSAEAVMDAAAREGRALALFAVGGERPEFIGRLAEDGVLRGVAALFPEIVGRIGIDRVAGALAGTPAPETPTPHAIVTRETFDDHYMRDAAGVWTLRPERIAEAVGMPAALDLAGRGVAFMPHYPAHGWYRSMIAAMRERASSYKLELDVVPPHQGIVAERARIRGTLAARAAAEIRPGTTIIIGHGETGLLLAGELRRMAFDGAAAGVTAITNALDVLHRLTDAPGLRTLLTSGELQGADRCMVGPSVGALFERMRADVAFLGADGVTPEFGPSSSDERLALVAARCAEAARRVVVMADHLSVGSDATHRILRPDAYHELVTDDGTLPGERQRFRAAGTDVLVAGDADVAEIAGEERPAQDTKGRKTP